MPKLRTETRIIARYAETDQMGIVHHSVYAVWFEAGRTDFLRKAGFSYGEIEKKEILLPLYELRCKFISPALYEDEIIIRTTLDKITNYRLFFSYEVISAAGGKLLATGETMLACTGKNLKPLNMAKAMPDIYEAMKQAACC